MHKTIQLIREFFNATLAEMKELTGTDRQQLASSWTRAQGLAPESCEFELIAY
jgi:hypothetical protein